MQLTRIFAQLGKADLPLAGGKGANLGEMVQAGLPVPPGFVLLTEAYRMFVRQAGIQAAIENLANDAHPDSQESLDTTSARIRALFDGHAVPAEVAAAITEAYAALGGGPVAVRSSATAEDLPDASFAGQQETYLNIQGPEAVVNACRRCWSSLWTGRAIAYRLKNGIAPGDVALAVVVQQLVAADVAGVLFTVDPVSGRRDRMTIDGAWGLGESVVSGVVSPDHWVADGKTGAVITEQLAAKTVMTVRTAEGTEERPVPAGWQLLPVLDAAKVAALVDLGRRTAAYFGSPQDIEWALSGGQFYLLQSRPVTTLFPVPEPAPGPDDGLRVYVSFYAVQGVIEPITPAGIAAFRATVEGVLSFTGLKQASAGRQYLAVAAGRLFIDVTDVMRRFGHRLAGNFMDVDMQQALQDLLAREKRLRPAGGVVARGVNKLLMLRTALRALYAMLNPEGAREGARRRIEADIAALEQESRGLTGVPDRVRFVRRALGAILPTIIRTPPLFVPALVIRSKLLKKLAAWGLDPALMDPVGRSIPHNPTTEMDLALWQLSRTLLEQGAEPRADHPAVQAFLEQYGHRATREIDMGVPRWRDDPQQILHILSGYMTQGAGVTDPEHHFRSGAAAAVQGMADLVGRVRRAKGPFHAALVRFLLGRFRRLAGSREWHKFYMVRVLALGRRVLAEAGADLVRAGRLDQADDVFYLDFRDLESQQDLRQLAARNRAAYERELKRRMVPKVITSEGEVLNGVPSATDGVLKGTGASAGVHEGFVRIILDPVGARLEPGEVLVAPGTDPAWTPLFLTAGALITETGGMMSHGSVVAREYAIPAVVSVMEATTRLRTGQRVRVDGSSGTVVLLD